MKKKKKKKKERKKERKEKIINEKSFSVSVMQSETFGDILLLLLFLVIPENNMSRPVFIL